MSYPNKIAKTILALSYPPYDQSDNLIMAAMKPIWSWHY